MNLSTARKLLTSLLVTSGVLLFFRCEYLVYPSEKKEPVWHIYFNKSLDSSPSDEIEARGNIRIDLKLAERILASKSTIDLCFYEIESDTIKGAIKKAHEAGKQVRIITDDQYLVEVGDLDSLGIPVISDSAGGVYVSKEMHNKFGIFDSEWVWTGSYNATARGTFGNANNVIEFKSAEIAAAFTTEFNEMWGSSSKNADTSQSRFHTRKKDNHKHVFELDGYALQVYMSPSDDTEEAIVNAIATADYEIYFCIFSFTDDDLATAMEAQLNESPELIIRGVFDETQAGSQFSMIDTMKSWGTSVTVRVDAVTDTSGAERFLHHKYLLIDANHSDSDPILVTGSANWSNNGFNYNDENTIVVYNPEIVERYLQEFEARFQETQ